MRKTLLVTALALGAVFAAPRAARADCLTEAIESCDADFGGSSNYFTVSIRGYCYAIRWGACLAVD